MGDDTHLPRLPVPLPEFDTRDNVLDRKYRFIEVTGSYSKLPSPRELWDTIAIDLLILPLTSEGHQYLLVVIDHFSRVSVLVPLKNKSPKTVAEALVDEVLCKFNTPRVLLSDNGTEFNNQTLQEICRQFEFRKCNTVTYHPASCCWVERQNRKTIHNLRSLEGDVSSSWQEWMPQVVTSINSSLQYPPRGHPHFVVFGQDKRLLYSLLLHKAKPIYSFADYVIFRVADFQKAYKGVH